MKLPGQKEAEEAALKKKQEEEAAQRKKQQEEAAAAEAAAKAEAAAQVGGTGLDSEIEKHPTRSKLDYQQECWAGRFEAGQCANRKRLLLEKCYRPNSNSNTRG